MRRDSGSTTVQPQPQAADTQRARRRRSSVRAAAGTNESQVVPTVSTEKDPQWTPGTHGSKKVWRNWGSGDTACGIIITSNSAEANSSAAGSAGVMDSTQHIHFPVSGRHRTRDFHAHFEDIPKDEDLIEDYSCALQKDILAHGRLYVSRTHLSFSSHILGWTTALRIDFDDITSIEKRNTALIFKNGLKISTDDDQYVFASLLNRDATYDLITNIWDLANDATKPGARSPAGGISDTEKEKSNKFHRRKRPPQERQEVEEEGKAEKEAELPKEMKQTQIDESGRPPKSVTNVLPNKTRRIVIALTMLVLLVYIFTRAGFRGWYDWNGKIEARERQLQALEKAIRIAEERLSVLQDARE